MEYASIPYQIYRRLCDHGLFGLVCFHSLEKRLIIALGRKAEV